MKTALITGITGQDGSYLAEFLLDKGYDVNGIVRRSSTFNTERINHIYNNPHLHLHYGDLSESGRLYDLIASILPDEIYNLGAQSHVRVSFDEPEYTSDIVALGSIRILECIRRLDKVKKIKYYQASSSEMFGKVQEIPQKETTPFYPRSPYGCSKVYSYWVTKNYREAYDIFACNGILFNHESERRGKTFVTRKITEGVARIYHGLQDKLYLGNLDAKRDWGYAKDYVEGMWMMLQHDTPDDFILATNETHTVREFCDLAFKEVGLNYEDYVVIDEKYYRPTEVDILIGDYTKAKTILGWEPKTKFKDLVKKMVEHDMKNYYMVND